MERGKDDAKATGPMFPRLHVNDTEKGGPRAPPRNKMALYEQLSIPSQRFNPSVMNTSSTTNTTLQASTSQDTGFKRKLQCPLHPPTPSHQNEKSFSSQSNKMKLSAPLNRLDKRKKFEEDDFRVPVYVRTRISQLNDNAMKNTSIENLTSVVSTYSGSDEIQNDCHLDSEQTGPLRINMRRDCGSLHANYKKDLKNENQVQSTVRKPGAYQLLKSIRSPTTGGNLDGSKREAASLACEHSVSDISRLHNGDTCFQIKPKDSSQCNGAEHSSGLVDSTKAIRSGDIHVTISCFDSVENATDPTKSSGIVKHGTKMGNSFHPSNLDKSDSVSKDSVVDAVSSMEISPDDVVGIIGQKHFLKARKVITKQQRVFAVQVFELHRLIKIQHVLDASPELLVEDAIFLGKTSPKISPAKKISLGCVVKPRTRILKCNDIPENPSHKMDCSAENGDGKPSVSSVRNCGDPHYYPPCLGNAQHANTAADNKIGPWCSSQLPGHQWLVPVMSPSEGLVYKPYPGPEYSGSLYGGSEPYGPAAFTGSFISSAYGGPIPYHGTGVFPGNQPLAHPYVPHYGPPVVSSTVSGSGIEQMNHVGDSGSFGQSNQLSAGGSNSTKHPIPSDALNQITRSAPHLTKFQSCMESELLGSTASGPGDIVQGAGPREVTQGRDAPTPIVQGPHSRRTEQQLRVIKVVPHNRISAIESAARIFQSIQENRKQLDSV